jgi:hypothetical protein
MESDIYLVPILLNHELHIRSSRNHRFLRRIPLEQRCIQRLLQPTPIHRPTLSLNLLILLARNTRPDIQRPAILRHDSTLEKHPAELANYVLVALTVVHKALVNIARQSNQGENLVSGISCAKRSGCVDQAQDTSHFFLFVEFEGFKLSRSNQKSAKLP